MKENNARNIFQKVTRTGGILMLFSLTLMTCSFMISFPFAEHFTIVQQAVAHIFTIVMAGVFKVGYVAFIVGKYERKLPF
jgi:hypothetical protein